MPYFKNFITKTRQGAFEVKYFWRNVSTNSKLLWQQTKFHIF